jgi:hypothetical protein
MLGLAGAAMADCKLATLAAFPISFVNGQPMVDVTINGKPARLRFSLGLSPILWGRPARSFGLKIEPWGSYQSQYTWGPGGAVERKQTAVDNIKLGGVEQKGVYLPVLDDKAEHDELGRFGISSFDPKNDIELDFAHDIVRVFKPEGCKGEEVVYWGGAYGVLEENGRHFWTVSLNGKAIDADLIPGNEVTFVTPTGLRIAGLQSRSAGAMPNGMLTEGTYTPIDVSIAVFPELALGDEAIRNAALAVGDVYAADSKVTGAGGLRALRPQIVLGSDFARSHRIYIARQQKKIYFSYVGGPVFSDIYTRLGVAPPAAESSAGGK